MLRGHVHCPIGETPPNQTIRGAMSFSRIAGLYFLPPAATMNGEKCVNLLKSKLELHMTDHNCDIFTNDGAPCYWSKAVKNFLEQKRIQRLEFPRNSLDLHRIENVHNFMTKSVSEKHLSTLMHSKQQLKKFGSETSLQIVAASWWAACQVACKKSSKTRAATQNIYRKRIWSNMCKLVMF